MQIVKLSICNYRQFEEVEVDFTSSLTALTGMNGSGKTTILKAIDLAMSYGAPEERIKSSDFLNPDEPIDVSIELSDYYYIRISDGWAKRFIPSKKIRLTLSHRKSSSRRTLNHPFVAKFFMEPYCYDGKENQGFSQDKLANIPILVDKAGNDGYFYHRNNNDRVEIGGFELLAKGNAVDLPYVSYLNESKAKSLNSGYYSMWSRLANELDWRFYRKLSQMSNEDEAVYNDGIIGTKEIIDNNSVGQLRADTIGALVDNATELLCDKFGNLDISFINPEHPHQNAEIALTSPCGQRIIGLENLGMGEKSVLALLLSIIVARYANRTTILLIDELEVHLHPQLMHRLLEYLDSTGIQVIYSTHSESLINLGKWRSVKRLHNAKVFPQKNCLDEVIDGKTVAEHLDDISHFYYDMRILKREDAQMLFANKMLLVEGVNDKFGLPNAAKKLDVSLDAIDTIVPVYGKGNFCHYQILCKAFEIDTFVVFDQDDVDDEKNTRLNQQISANAGGASFMFPTSFEQALGIGENSKSFVRVLEAIRTQNIPQDVNNCINQIGQWLDGD